MQQGISTGPRKGQAWKTSRWNYQESKQWFQAISIGRENLKIFSNFNQLGLIFLATPLKREDGVEKLETLRNKSRASLRSHWSVLQKFYHSGFTSEDIEAKHWWSSDGDRQSFAQKLERANDYFRVKTGSRSSPNKATEVKLAQNREALE